MTLYSGVVNWSLYLHSQLSLAEADVRYAEADLDIKRIKLGVDGRTKEGRAAENNPEYIDLKGELLYARVQRDLVESMFKQQEAKATVLSRELSRRISQQGRSNKYE